jgi:hypothetical protein
LRRDHGGIRIALTSDLFHTEKRMNILCRIAAVLTRITNDRDPTVMGTHDLTPM